MNNTNKETFKKNTLILRSDARDYFGKQIKSRGYNILDPYNGQFSIFTRFLRRVHFKSKLPFKTLWYNKKILKHNAKSIVIFETQITREYLIWLRDNHKSKVHVWYWNIVKNTVNPDELRDVADQLWTFSSRESKEFNMLFNAPPYFNDIKLDELATDLDVVFVGKDKGRAEKLFEYERIFQRMGLKTHFHIAPNKRWQKKKIHKRKIDYSETLRFTARTKAVFDLIEIVDSGLSMRAMETLFLKKKLITNNILIKNYDFYDSKNIFILGIDKIEELPDFVNSPFIEIDEKIKLFYDFDYWLKRFTSLS